MKKDKENTQKEKSQNASFSRRLAKEKEEQENYKVKLKRREQKYIEDLKVREAKLKVDIRTFDKQKNQQKMLNRFSSRQCSAHSARGSFSSSRSSVRSHDSKGSVGLQRASAGSRSCGRSADFSNLMAPDPRAEVNRS